MRSLFSMCLISKMKTLFFIGVIVLVYLYVNCPVAHAEGDIIPIAGERPPMLWLCIDALLPIVEPLPPMPYLGGHCIVADVFFTFLDRDQVIVTVHPVSAEGVVVDIGWAYRDGHSVGPTIPLPNESAVMEISYRPEDQTVHLEIDDNLFEFDNTGDVVVWGPNIYNTSP